jgi:hypothetical protein
MKNMSETVFETLKAERTKAIESINEAARSAGLGFKVVDDGVAVGMILVVGTVDENLRVRFHATPGGGARA